MAMTATQAQIQAARAASAEACARLDRALAVADDPDGMRAQVAGAVRAAARSHRLAASVLASQEQRRALLGPDEQPTYDPSYPCYDWSATRRRCQVQGPGRP